MPPLSEAADQSDQGGDEKLLRSVFLFEFIASTGPAGLQRSLARLVVREDMLSSCVPESGDGGPACEPVGTKVR